EQLLELYFEYRPDVVFLDIEMPGITGVEAAKQITASTNEHPLFVFTTAYDTYAVDALAIESLDYLFKPFDQVRLQQSFQRIMIKLRTGEEDTSDAKEAEAPPPASNKLLVDDGEKMIVISPESIYYAVPSQRMLEIHTENEVIESKMTLQELEKKLSGRAF